MKVVHYLNGAWVPTEELQISVFDLSVLRGFGIFDFLRTYNHKPFKLREHIDRLCSSAKYTGITIPLPKTTLLKIVNEGIEKNKDAYDDFNIRIIVTGGVGVDSLTPGKPSVIALFTKAIQYSNEHYTKGVKVITVKMVRTIPEAKTLNYFMAIIALQKARKEKAIEAIYIDSDGKLYEGTTSNIFFIKNKTLTTPKTNILPGITRKIVIDLAKKLEMKVEERNVFLGELTSFQEAFISASNKEIMPVVQVDRRAIGEGIVGEKTTRLIKAYRTLLR